MNRVAKLSSFDQHRDHATNQQRFSIPAYHHIEKESAACVAMRVHFRCHNSSDNTQQVCLMPNSSAVSFTRAGRRAVECLVRLASTFAFKANGRCRSCRAGVSVLVILAGILVDGQNCGMRQFHHFIPRDSQQRVAPSLGREGQARGAGQSRQCYVPYRIRRTECTCTGACYC